MQDIFELKDQILTILLPSGPWEMRFVEWARKKIAPSFTIIRHSSGKPLVRGVQGLYLSVSTTAHAVVIGLASQEIGIDAEITSRRVSYLEIARRFFTQEELEWILLADNSDKQKERFFALWTAREASVKLDGSGIIQGFSRWQPLRFCETPVSCIQAQLAERKVYLRSFCPFPGSFATIASFLTIPEICEIRTIDGL